MHREAGRGLGRDRTFSVAARPDLDVDAADLTGSVRVLQLCIRDQDVAIPVDRELKLGCRQPPLPVGFSLALSCSRRFASSGEDAFQFGVDPDPPDLRTLPGQSLDLRPAGPAYGRVVRASFSFTSPDQVRWSATSPFLTASLRANEGDLVG